MNEVGGKSGWRRV